jgi:hypothetical protein
VTLLRNGLTKNDGAGGMRPARLGLLRLALLLALLLAAQGSSLPQGLPQNEYEVKAAFLYNFTRFIEWPADQTSQRDEFVIGIIGEDPFQESIAELTEGKTVAGKPIVIRRFASIESLTHCHILFVSGSEEKRLGPLLDAVHGTGVLTVSDIRGFTGRGGMISLFLDRRRVRFAVNTEALAASQLKVSSKLLALARGDGP